MLELSVQFLGGDFVAETPGMGSEWPPHPARLLYALIAAWYDGGCGQAEEDALRWLESQNSPSIVAARDAPEETYDSWVPINSVPTLNKKSGKAPSLPKTPQLRSSRYVGDDPISFVWDVNASEEHESALRVLCQRCTRLGSSDSLVAMTVKRRDALYGTAWRPAAEGTPLRTPMPGIVDSIQQTETLMPGRILLCDWRIYRWSSRREQGSMITLRLARGNWPVEHAPMLADQLRKELIAVAQAGGLPLLPILHGRDDDGSPLRRSHLHVCPLPHVSFRYATGAVLGVALIVPPNAAASERSYVERVVANWFSSGGELTMTHGRTLSFGPADSRHTLTDGRWCRTATAWQTVIPMELPRHVSRRRHWNRDDWRRVAEQVELACSQAGIPPPIEVEASNSAFAIGSPNPRSVRGPHRRPIVHARILLPSPVDGPLVLGSGRHLGYGLMEPVEALT